MKKALILTGVFIFVFSFAASEIFADDHTEKEVRALIKKVEQTIDKYNETGVDKWAGKDMAVIEEFIKKAKSFIDEGDIDEAWYEMGKAEAYFKLIEAKKEYNAAEKELKAVQDNR